MASDAFAGEPGTVDLARVESIFEHCRGVVAASRQRRGESHVLHARYSASARAVGRLCHRLGRPLPRLRMPTVLSGGAGALTGRRIVLVVDDPDQRDLIGLLLGWYGADVATVSTADVTAFVERLRPDMILMELPFDRTRAFALAGQLSTQLNGNGTKPSLVALTKHAYDHRESEALGAGFNGQIAEPLEPELFEQALAALLPAA